MFSDPSDASLQVSRTDLRCFFWIFSWSRFIFKFLSVCLRCLMDAGMPDEQREGLQEELIDIILRVLVKNPQLHYYQGYHDIVVTFLLVLGERLATALVEKLSTHHLRWANDKKDEWQQLRLPGFHNKALPIGTQN
ncbi:hypothetical protein M9458_044421 [Cirrhinus mrigala]|uniref:Uncharacterized protein n=1 Tax=Cirrhinus mrigala TaxID=683832 RepID=A0ABD0NHT6_CIRMR